MTYTTQGIVLKKISVGETDAVVVLYTYDFGKLRTYAQGVNKESAKLKGHVEPLSLCLVQFVIGAYGERLTYAQMLEHLPKTKQNFDTYAVSRYMTELIDCHCMHGQKDERIWKLLLGGLLSVEKGDNNSLLMFLNSFEQDLVHCLGYGTTDGIRSLGISLARPFGIV